MTEDLTRGDAGAGSQSFSGTEGAEQTIGQASVIVGRPAPGETVAISAEPGSTYVLDFDPSQARAVVEGDNLILVFEDGSQIVFEDLVNLAQLENGPGLQYAGADMIALLQGQGIIPGVLDDIELLQPEPGQIVQIQAELGQRFTVNFDPAIAVVTVEGDIFVITFPGGEQILIVGLPSIAGDSDAPVFYIAGTPIGAGTLVQTTIAIGEDEASPDATAIFETAAGADQLPSGGVGPYREDTGDTIDTLKAQDVIPPVEGDSDVPDVPPGPPLDLPNNPPVAFASQVVSGEGQVLDLAGDPVGFFYRFDVGENNDVSDNIHGTDTEDGVTSAFTITSLPANGVLVIDRDSDDTVDEVYGLTDAFIPSAQPLPSGGLDIDTGDTVYYFLSLTEAEELGVLPDSVTFNYFTTDSDGLTSDQATLAVTFDGEPMAEDDNPETDPEGTVVDEASGDLDGNGSVFTPVAVSGNVLDNDNFGIDGAGTPEIVDAAYDGALGAAVKDTGVSGQITFTASNWTLVLITGGADAGDYTFTQTGPFGHDTVQGTNSSFGNFTYTMQDSDGDTASADLTIQIVDDVPNAVDDGVVAIAEDTAKVIDVFANDSAGADEVALAGGIALTTDGSKGSAVYNNNGTFTYTPDPGATGSDSFTYTITDGDGDTSTATVSVNIGADSMPSISSTDALVDEDDLVPDGSDQTAEPGGDRVDEGSVTVDFFNDQPGNLTGAFAFTGGSPANGPNGAAITYTASGDGQSLTAKIGGVDIFTVTITGTTDNGGGNVTYAYQVTLLASMDHLIGDNGQNSFDFSANFTVTDSDGSSANSNFDITVVDDVPADISPDATVIGSNGVFPQIETEDLGFFGNVNADQPGDVTFDPDLQGEQLFADDLTTAIMSNGSNIVLDISDAGHLLTGYVESGDTAGYQALEDSLVFTIQLDPDAIDEGADEYTVTLFDKMDTGALLMFDNFSDIDPGGPKDFIALDDPRMGANDLNQDVVFTANPISDKLNNSTQGSGVGNQQVDTTEVFRIDFVTNVAGVNDANPAIKDNFGSLAYDAHYTVNNAGFTISQSFGPATVNMSAYDADDDLNFDGDADDVQDTIVSVSVKDETGTFVIQNATVDTISGGIGIVFEADGTVTVSGLLLDYQTLVSTADGFNRIEIEAVVEKWDFGGAVFSTFDAGEPIDMDFAVVLTDQDGDTANGTIELTVLPQQTADPAGETLIATEFGSDLVGQGGVDTLVGGAAADKLQGGGGADTISDGTGTDLIIGGDGADTVNLAADNETDTVIFDALSEIGDTVNGFDTDAPGNGDILDLVDLLDTATDFTGTSLTEAVDDGYIQLLQNGGDTEVRIDLNGGGNDFSTLVATLDSVTNSDLADNILVD